MNKKLKKCTVLTLSAFACAAIGAGVALNQVGKTAEVKAATPAVGTTYKLVSSVSDLEAGANYALVGVDGSNYYAAATDENTNNRKTVSITVNQGSFSSTAKVLNLELGGKTDEWTFKTTNYAGKDGYLASAASGSYNYLKVVEDKATCTIAIDNNGVASIVLGPHTSKNNVRYNTSGMFACYSSGQNDVYLYKAIETTDPKVTLDKESISSHLGSVSDSITATVSFFATTVTYDWHIKDGSATDVVSVQGIDETAYVTFLKAGNTIVEVEVTDGTSTVKAECAVTITNQVTYPLLSDPAEVYSGMEFIFVADAGTSGVHASGFFEGSNTFISAVDAGFVLDGSAYAVNDNAQVFTIGGTIDEWTISGATDGMIWAKSGTSGKLYKDSSTKPEGSVNTWKIDYDTSSDVVCMCASDGNAIQYNKSNPRFAYYTSSQVKTRLFYKEATDPVFNWIQHNMRMGDSELKGEGTGTCASGGLYSTAKTELMKLSAEDIQNFHDDKDGKYTAALARYNAWAVANGDENPFEPSMDFGSSIKSVDSVNVAIIIAIASILTVSATAAILISKKKKAAK